MKSEHRHELQTNELSAQLAQWVEKMKPYSGQIGTGILALAIVYAGLSVWDSQVALDEQQAWDAFAMANDLSDREMQGLYEVANKEEYAGTSMQEWAYVNWADQQVFNAMASSLVDREITNERLGNVEKVYDQMASNASDPQVKNRARFGLARTYELQNKLDEAKQQYQRVQGSLKSLAEDRLTQLDSEKAAEISNWLSTAELPKRDQTGEQGATGERPKFEANVSDTSKQSKKSGISTESLEALLESTSGDEENDAEQTPDISLGTVPATGEEAPVEDTSTATEIEELPEEVEKETPLPDTETTDNATEDTPE